MTSSRLAERSIQIHAPRAQTQASRPGVRGQILEAALIEFADRGFQEASLAAIARRVGVTAPLVLYHFGSKANLWREALEVFCASFAGVVQGAVIDGTTLDGREALRLLVRRLVYFFAANRAAYRLLRDDGSADTTGSEWLASRNLRPVIDQVEKIYLRAVSEGSLRAAPFETTFFMILGMISCYLESRGLVSHLFRESGEEGEHWVEEYADQVLALLFDGLTPRRERPMLAALRAAMSGPATEASLS